MKKIPTLFKRDANDRRYVTDEVTPGCEWVLAGEGVATRKYDGTCTMLDDVGRWWARREIKPGKTEPANFRAEEHDEVTGKTVGWEPIEQSPFVKFWDDASKNGLKPGTYELCGPKINGDPDRLGGHYLISHQKAEAIRLPPTLDYRTCARAVTDLGAMGWEGIVWHHPDGRMAKLKARDFA
jgi:hypothetical protein